MIQPTHALNKLILNIVLSAVQGVISGPVVAAMYSCCTEVLDHQYVNELYSLFRTGGGIGCLIGPALAGT